MDIHRCRFVDYTPHTITSLAFSHPSTTKFTPFDLRLAVGRANGDIEIWNPRYNWIHEQTLQGGKGRSVEGLVWSVWSDTTPRLFSIGGSTIITEWDLQSGMPLKNHDCNAGVIWSIAINGSGDKLAVGCDDGSVVIVDISGGPGSLEHESILQRQDSRVLSITWSDDDLVIGGCADGRVRVWSAKGENKARLVSTLRVDKSKTESTLVWSVLALPKKNQLVTGDSTGSVKFWNLQHFVLLQSYQVHDLDVLCLASDFEQEKIFSGGIDRKIFNFSLIAGNGSSRWINSSNRLLHSNDIRSLASFESKGSNFLISGGVERSIVINSVNNFHNGPYRKLPIVLQKPNLITNSARKLVIMWQDQTIKIWKINELDRSKKLVSKLTLADEENITTCCIDKTGSYLAVGRLTNIKIFKISELEDRESYKVKKVKSLVNYNAKHLIISDENLFTITSDNRLIGFKYDIVEDSLVLDEKEAVEYELPELSKIRSKAPHIQNVNNFKISEDETKLAVSRLSGSIEIVDLKKQESHRLIKLNQIPINMEFTRQNTLVVINLENKLYEFNISKQSLKKQDLLTTWSKRNSEFLPSKFLKLTGKCQGFFKDNLNSKRIWLYGDNWLCFFDLNYNIPIDEVKYGNANGKSQLQLQQLELRKVNKKRRRNSSVVMTLSETTNTVDDSLNLDYTDGVTNSEADAVDDDHSELISSSNGQINDVSKNLRDLEINRFIKNGVIQQEDEDERCFWFTNKYSSLMLCDNFGYNEIIVVERPLFLLPAPPAFKLNKIIV